MKGSRLLRMVVAGALLAGALGSCGGEADDTVRFDSNTNWLKSCSVDDDCGGALSCICGICTQPCGTHRECGLLSQAECRPSKNPQCASAPNTDGGGLCVLPCESDNACPVLFSCAAGQCIPPAPAALVSGPEYGNCPFITWDDVYQAVEADVLAQDEEARPYLRYATLANQIDAGDCGNARLGELRQALSRVLNSLSSTALPHQPEAIRGGVETYRIDLRDYGWSFERGPVADGFRQYDDAWELLIANSPYAVEFQGDAAENVILQLGTTVPVIFADALIGAVMQPSVYYGMTGIPEDLAALRAKLQIDVVQSRADGLAVRAGYSNAGRDLLAERHPQAAREGLYYWQISDFGASPALVNTPLGELSGESEVVFTLPNGLLAFAIYNGSGVRGAEATVSRNTTQAGDAYRIPRSAFLAHAQGFEVTDTVREGVLGNAGAYAPQIVQSVRSLYPPAESLSALTAQDAGVYRTALGLAGVRPGDENPIRRVFDAYDADVRLSQVAGDVMYPEESLKNDVPRLDPGLSGLDDGFAVDRRDWSSLYLESLCILSVGNENQPSDAECASLGL